MFGEVISSLILTFSNLTIFRYMGREEIKEIVGMKLFSFCNFRFNWNKLWNSFWKIRRERSSSIRLVINLPQVNAPEGNHQSRFLPSCSITSLNTSLHLDSLKWIIPLKYSIITDTNSDPRVMINELTLSFLISIFQMLNIIFCYNY